MRGVKALERTRDKRAPNGRYAPSFEAFAAVASSPSSSMSMSGGVFGGISSAPSSSSSSGSNVNASLLARSQLNIVAINAKRPCDDDETVDVVTSDISSNAQVASHNSPRAFSSPRLFVFTTSSAAADKLLLYSPSSMAAMANAADDAALSSPAESFARAPLDCADFKTSNNA